MSECSSNTEVSKSMLVRLTTALLRRPPVLFAMTCSDSCRSCDSSGMSRRMKTTSNRDRRAEPILQGRRAASSSRSNSVKKRQKLQCTKCLPLTWDSQRQSSLGCNVPRLGLQLRWLMFWQAARKLFLPSPDSPSAAPWLRAEPAAGSRSCQTHQYNTRLQCAERERGGVIRKINRKGSDKKEERMWGCLP